jgi:hypothetical protein
MRTALRLLALAILAAAAAWWIAAGSNTGWTKTYTTVQKTDPVTGIVYEEKTDRFVPGVDFLAASAIASMLVFAGSLLPALRKNPKHKQ